MSFLREIQHDLGRTFRREGDGHYIDWATAQGKAHRAELAAQMKGEAWRNLAYLAIGAGFGLWIGSVWL